MSHRYNGFQRGPFRAIRAKWLIWRRGWDSNPWYGFRPYNGLANRRLQPLGHLSVGEMSLFQRVLMVKAENQYTAQTANVEGSTGKIRHNFRSR